MITMLWMQAGAHGGTPLQFEKAACRNFVSFMSLCPINMSLCPTKYVFMSNKNMSFCLKPLMSLCPFPRRVSADGVWRRT